MYFTPYWPSRASSLYVLRAVATLRAVPFGALHSGQIPIFLSRSFSRRRFGRRGATVSLKTTESRLLGTVVLSYEMKVLCFVIKLELYVPITQVLCSILPVW